MCRQFTPGHAFSCAFSRTNLHAQQYAQPALLRVAQRAFTKCCTLTVACLPAEQMGAHTVARCAAEESSRVQQSVLEALEQLRVSAQPAIRLLAITVIPT